MKIQKISNIRKNKTNILTNYKKEMLSFRVLPKFNRRLNNPDTEIMDIESSTY